MGQTFIINFVILPYDLEVWFIGNSDKNGEGLITTFGRVGFGEWGSTALDRDGKLC